MTRKDLRVIAPDPLYKSPNRIYGFRKCCETIRDAVPIEEVASRYTNLESFGGKAWFTGRCPLPDHDDKTPSFYFYPPGRYHCYGCGGNGDVVDLEFHCGDYGELWEAMMSLAVENGVELPQRPASWFARQERQKPIRDGIASVRREIRRRRLFRCFVLPVIDTIEAEEEREQELERAWSDFQRVPLP
jgi:CHC2 zinc finger